MDGSSGNSTVAGYSEHDHTAALRDSVNNYVGRGAHRQRSRGLRGNLPGYERKIWAEMAELGWLGILIPSSYGGLGLGLAEAAVVAQGLARAVMPEPFTAACVLAVNAIVRGDNEELKERLLPAIVSGEILPALAWQERFEPSAPLAVQTLAECAAGGVTLTGTKRFIAGAAGADGFVVSAQTVGGDVSLYWVPRDAQGMELTFELLADGTFGTTLHLARVPVTAGQLIASRAVAGDALQQALDQAAIVAAAELFGIAACAFDMTLDYLRTRRQFGKAIGSFQALQHRAVDGYVQQELAAAVLHEAIASFASLEDAGARSAMASRAKARCSDAALSITREAVQMHGAIGFTDEYDIGLFVKRVLVLRAWLGSASSHRRRFARNAPLATTETPRRGTVVPKRLEELPADTAWDQLADDDFRLLLRGFIETHYPEELRYLGRRVRWHEVRDWNLKLAERGWIAPSWPRVWGGMELSPSKQLIYIDELERWGVGRAPDQGVRQLGPVLMRYGTDEQKRAYLPKILSCEHIWCQGYSEPNAGSDLASVTTSAVIDGDELVINGQKIWTSMALDSTHIYVLCRTDTTVKKQEGISFIIVDLKTPGITVRPIRDIAGHDEFCEIFFDNVRAPITNLIGGLNKGWTVAKAVLDFERLGIGSPRRPLIAFNRLAKLAVKLGLLEDAGFLDRFTQLRLDLIDHATLYEQFAERAARRESLGPEVSILKIWGMEAFQRVIEFALEAAEAHGAAAGDIELDHERIDLMTPFYMSRLITIGGGSNEIQRNIVAKYVLRLPS
jgi:alkylation response protein AidB-like acyl-CoA dehydrogenase